MTARPAFLALTLLSLSACSDDATDGAAVAGATADDVGRCAVDPGDGMSYGRIVEVTTDEATGAQMVRTEADGGATWTKRADNVAVEDC